MELLQNFLLLICIMEPLLSEECLDSDQMDTDECSDPQGQGPLCYNNGSCFNTPGSYGCNCSAGWEGLKCETDINECQNETLCKFKCINIPGSFLCLCEAGWTGEHCYQDIDECSDPQDQGPLCYNNGSCFNTPGSYGCNCSAGWEGLKCETDINECKNNTLCKFKCINTPGSYQCFCDASWTGEHCDQAIDFARRIEYWNDPKNQRKQLETLNKTLLEIKANLTIDKKKLTSNRIKRISAPDPRQSAAIAGYLGAGVISFVFGLLLCLGLTRCFSGQVINVDREI